ncbi:YihY/virulence factor BrkB family protein [Winogradskyella immobilis]|uniref:YihY/virulence factor BrkB family protein n=1 Tax=Winogradskyella immobilis TaxID=2816852 RepID=A0ABS8EPA5_9FLAO|nr:YihY/virulence factor BrkB family protein [Winogradskyella immobilis]MCC1484836.1 YihY/virulence factor BrkB family protein [Winogradskyella immobilis]MCG0016928.1 YihY/virulence factor BrkB family protein [Winogradskyella immobilis]
MSKSIEDKLDKIPVVNQSVKVCKKIRLPGFEGLSIYDLLELYVIGIVKGTLTTRASAIAFSFFTAIFPFLLFLIILIPYIPTLIPNMDLEVFQYNFRSFLKTSLPPQTSDFFMDSIFQNLEGNNKQVGLLSSVFVLSMFLMTNGVNAVFSGFENSYHKQLTRNIIQQYMYALGIALILAILVLITVAFFGYFQIYVISPLYESINNEVFMEESSKGLGWITPVKYSFFIIMVYLSTAILYFFGTKEGRKTRFFSVGALLTTLLIILTSYLFGIYIDDFSNYNKLYGSIGGLLILLLYLWLNANILLLGYELNATLRGLEKINQSK